MPSRPLLSFALVFVVVACGRSTSYARQPVPSSTAAVQAAPMCCLDCGRKIAGQLYTMPGVRSVDLDFESKTLSIAYQRGRTPSPRLICAAVMRTDDRPVSVSGPFGTISIQYRAAGQRPTASVARTAVTLQRARSTAAARAVAAEISAGQRVADARFEVSTQTLYLTPPDGADLDAWRLWEAVERAGDHAIAIEGPAVTLSNDHLLAARHAPQSPARSSR